MNYKLVLIQQINNFIEEIYELFPNHKDVILFKEKFSLLKSVNSQLIVDYFIKFVYPFKDSIVKEDEIFFIEGGGQDELKDKNGLNIRDNLKDLWENHMSEDNKKIVWKYFKTFVLLCEKYILENMNK